MFFKYVDYSIWFTIRFLWYCLTITFTILGSYPSNLTQQTHVHSITNLTQKNTNNNTNTTYTRHVCLRDKEGYIPPPSLKNNNNNNLEMTSMTFRSGHLVVSCQDEDLCVMFRFLSKIKSSQREGTVGRAYRKYVTDKHKQLLCFPFTCVFCNLLNDVWESRLVSEGLTRVAVCF